MSGGWIKARDARDLLAPDFGDVGAEQAIRERAHTGLLRARARLLRVGIAEKRNAEVPRAMWLVHGGEVLIQDWQLGDFSAWVGSSFQGALYQAFDVSFDWAELIEMLPAARRIEMGLHPTRKAGPDSSKLKLPRLPDADLQKWWQKMGDERETLGEKDLLIRVSSDYPGNHISRERIRALMGKRKRGPKPFRGKTSAK